MSDTLSNLSTETRSFPPDPRFAARANLTEDAYACAEADREGFWAEQAAALSWAQPWEQVLDWRPPFAKWFVGGRLNVAYNCVDRHVRQNVQFGQPVSPILVRPAHVTVVDHDALLRTRNEKTSVIGTHLTATGGHRQGVRLGPDSGIGLADSRS